MDQKALAAQIRYGKGKGVARKLRMKNQIPAIFYGPGTKPVMLVLDYSDLTKLLRKGLHDNNIIDLEIQSDHGNEHKKAMIKDLAIHPISNDILHADFYEISMDRRITANIPLHLIGSPKGVVLNGGMIQHIRRELHISCLPDKLVDNIELDISGLDVGESLHIADITPPEGITLEDDASLAVVVIQPPAASKSSGTQEGEATGEAEGASS